MQSPAHEIKHIKDAIRNAEAVLFKSGQPVQIDKVDPDLDSYCSEYDEGIRRPEASYILVIDEIMLRSGKKSRAVFLLNELEEKLTHPGLYRDMIFNSNFRALDLLVSKFAAALKAELAFISRELEPSVYEDIIGLFPSSFPKTKNEFVKRLMRYLNDTPFTLFPQLCPGPRAA